MKAIILAAGRGSRMNELTSEKPKCMLEFKNRPLIDWQSSALIESGINEIAVVAGYKKEKIICKNIIKFFENPQWQTTNMVYSLFCADEWLEKNECVISYSDIFYTPKIVKSLLESDADISITYDKNFAELWSKRFSNPLNDLESFKIDKNSFLQEIGKKSQSISEIQGQFMGLLKFTPKGWEIAKNILKNYDIKKLDCTSALQILVSNDIKIKAIAIDDMWGEADNADDLRLYEELY